MSRRRRTARTRRPAGQATVDQLPTLPAAFTAPSAGLPAGPALLYRTTTGALVQVDTQAVSDPRERDLYRSLSQRAARLADAAERAAPPGTGHYL